LKALCYALSELKAENLYHTVKEEMNGQADEEVRPRPTSMTKLSCQGSGAILYSPARERTGSAGTHFPNTDGTFLNVSYSG
jgi:hypothetical protein